MAGAIEVSTGLNPKQKAFCELYVTGDKEFFGNGVECYIEVYEIDKTKKGWYNNACSSASRLLSNAKIIEYINTLLEEAGFNDQNVEKQHLFLINQHADLKTKKGAIDSYYKLKGKFAPEQPLLPQNTTINFNILATPEAKKLAEEMDKVVMAKIYEGKIIETAPQDGGQAGEDRAGNGNKPVAAKTGTDNENKQP